MITPPTEPASRQRRARALREQVESAPGHELVLARSELLATLPPPRLNGDEELADARAAQRYAQGMLAQHGLRVTPSLVAAESEAVRVEASRAYAVQGAATVAVLATLAGLSQFWAYGLIFVITGLAAVALVGFGFSAVRRRMPGWLPAGRLLGAGVAAALMLVAALLFALPVRHARSDDGGVGRAKSLVNQARIEIGAGHLDAAARSLAAAKQANAHPQLYDDTRADLIAARFQARLDAESRGG